MHFVRFSAVIVRCDTLDTIDKIQCFIHKTHGWHHSKDAIPVLNAVCPVVKVGQDFEHF